MDAFNQESDPLMEPHRLERLAPDAYRHPMDQQACAALRAVPGFELAATRFSRYSFERFLYNEYLASAVKVSERQCGGVHRLLLQACETLDMAPPALFLAQTPIVNAFALGKEEPAIVLQTGLVELLDEDELRAVIGHELGHIHCGHTIYRLMALFLALLARVGAMRAGYGDIFSIPIQLALLEWSRKAEFSADRAAVLTVQDPEIVFSALFKLTGGSPKIFAQMDRDAYLAQAEEYERPDSQKLDKFYRLLIESERSHPIPVVRAREALRWGASEDYRAILSGDYPRRGERVPKKSSKTGAPVLVTCPHCDTSTDAAFSFCTSCGQDRGEVA